MGGSSQVRCARECSRGPNGEVKAAGGRYSASSVLTRGVAGRVKAMRQT